MKLKLKKVYTVSQKANKPRIWLQNLVCEAAGFVPGEQLSVKIDAKNKEITLQNYLFDEGVFTHTVSVSSRKSKISGKERPLVDSAGDKYSFLDIKQKVEVNVFKQGNTGQVVIRPLQYHLFETNTVSTQEDERIWLLSVCAGAGVGTSVLQDAGYFTPVQEIELEDDSVEVLLENFPNSTVFAGDLRDCNEVVESDVAFVTLPCSEHSSLGFMEGNVMNDLTIAAATKIIRSSKAEALFFENVPHFFKSHSWESLKNLLIDEYPFWAQKKLDAWDFGSLATRKRVYAVAFRSEERFLSFQFPTPPKVRRRKLKDFLDPSSVSHEWKNVSDWMESFNSRKAWRDRSLNLTFLDKNAERILCIPKRYTAQSASNSHLLNEDGTKWRFFPIDEIKRIMGIPESFTFTENIPLVLH